MKMGRNIKFVSYIVQWKNAARKICVIFYAHFRFWPNDADQLDVKSLISIGSISLDSTIKLVLILLSWSYEFSYCVVVVVKHNYI